MPRGHTSSSSVFCLKEEMSAEQTAAFVQQSPQTELRDAEGRKRSYRQEKRPEVDSPGPGHPSGLEWAIWGSTDFRCRSPICPHFLQSLHSFTQQMRDSHPEMESLQILEKSQSLSNPQKPGGSDTPLLCSRVPGKQKSTAFCVLVTVTWDRLQLPSVPSSVSRVLDLLGLCLNRCGCWVAKSCLTLFDPVDCSMPGSFVLHYLLQFAQIHAHWVGDAI